MILEQAPIFYLIALIALIAVLAVGETRLGAKRWLPVLGIIFSGVRVGKVDYNYRARSLLQRSTHRAAITGGFGKSGCFDGNSVAFDPEAAGFGHRDGSGSGGSSRGLPCGYTMEACSGNLAAGCVC